MLKMFCKTCFCLLLCLCVLLSTACAAETIQSEVTYYSVTLKKEVQWTFEYSDQWFEKDADAYSHPIARASLGLAFSAFRSRNGAPDANAVAHLTELGFTGLVSEDFGLDTSIDTIGTIIGQKTLPCGETLIAVGVCGQGYKNEWLSNLDVGDLPEHKGFSSAAQKVAQRVERYVEDNGLYGARLWMSGYSRSAAVTNLAGAALLQKGLFNEKNAFIYTFATPRSTRNPVAYSNIFNIVGKFDPVTKLPYKEWGFNRHGTTLYTPAQETDSDYLQKQRAADVPFYQLTGIHMWNNPVLNHHLTVVESYLLSNIPTTADYDAHMKNHIANAWKNPGLFAMIDVLRAMASISPDEPENDAERSARVEDLVDYVANAALSVVATNSAYQDLILSGQVLPSVPILIEHIPDVYLAWMFSSDNPKKIFSEKHEYLQMVAVGDVTVGVFDMLDRFITGIDEEGELLAESPNGRGNFFAHLAKELPKPAILNVEDRSIIMLPMDQTFLISMNALSDSDLQYFGLNYDIRQSSPTISDFHLIHAEEGEEYVAFSLAPNSVLLPETKQRFLGDAHEIDQHFDADQLLSASEAERLASLNPIHLNVRGTVNFTLKAVGILLIVLLVLLVLLLICMIRWLLRKAIASRKA